MFLWISGGFEDLNGLWGVEGESQELSGTIQSSIISLGGLSLVSGVVKYFS